MAHLHLQFAKRGISAYIQLMKTDTETNVFRLQIGVESDIILIDTRPDYMLDLT